MRKSTLLTLLILSGVALGVLIGHYGLWDPNATREAVEQTTRWWKTAGDFVLMRPLMLIAAPLIFTSVLIGVTSVGDARRLGLLGGATLAYYLSTMVLAVVVGVTLAALFRPGVGLPDDVKQSAIAIGEQHIQSRGIQPAPSDEQIGGAWRSILEQLIPSNFAKAFVEAQYLSIITVSIVLGIGLLAAGQRAKPFLQVVEGLHEALMIIVRFILWVMPLGVMFLVAWSVGTMGLRNLVGALAGYVGTVSLGLGLHALITLPIVLWLFARANPFKYLWAMRPALFTAFGTASSMATLPVTIESSIEQGGCSRRASGLVLPLGATVNMDGTALYQGVAVIFMFQAFGYELHFAQYLIIVLTATLSAIGAAGIPAGGLVTTIIIITAVNTTIAAKDPNIPALPVAAGLGLILSVDRVLDMCRTTVNVWGDAVGARIISRLAPDDPTEQADRAKALG